MAEVLAEDDGVDEEGALHIHPLLPVNLLHHFIHLVCILGLKLLDRLQNLHCRACTEIGLVEHFLVAGEGHHTAAYLHVVGTQIDEFLCKHLFQTLEGLCDYLEFCHIFSRFLSYWPKGTPLPAHGLVV